MDQKPKATTIPINLKGRKIWTLEICMQEVREAGMNLNLQYVWEQKDEISMEAVRWIGLTPQHIWEQTPEICLAAVKQNGNALKHVVS